LRERGAAFAQTTACQHGCTSRKAASYNQFPCNTAPQGLMRPSPYGDVLQPFPYSTALKGLMTVVRILKFFALQKPTAQKWHGGHF
jgi:hypothetical protein